jgi:hypothetical protein
VVPCCAQGTTNWNCLQSVNDNNVKYIQQYIQCQEYTT